MIAEVAALREEVSQRTLARKRAYQREYMKKWRKTHPLTAEQRVKDIARSYAGVYKRRGELVPPKACECGESKVEMHHPDYGSPLDVIWLCRACHLKLHETVNADG